MRFTDFLPSAARASGVNDSIIGRAIATPPARRKFLRVSWFRMGITVEVCLLWTELEQEPTKNEYPVHSFVLS
jgi:hypothetical protein